MDTLTAEKAFDTYRAFPLQGVASPDQRKLLIAFMDVAGHSFRNCVGETVKQNLGDRRGLAELLFNQLAVYLWLRAIRPDGMRCRHSAQLDAIWLIFVGHTVEYQHFCDRVGGFIHREPTTACNRWRLTSQEIWLGDANKIRKFVTDDGKDRIIEIQPCFW